jgi:tRNA (cmo5U34)-methyltransferase
MAPRRTAAILPDVSDATHSVLAHLGVRAREYDTAIRAFVPGYEAAIATVVRWLTGHLPAGARVVELGAGTGALAEAILDALPDARVTLVDIDAAMLDVARDRLASHADRIELRHASFDDPLPRAHAVVASLALHHVHDLDAKRALYARIHEALEPGGLLLVADACVPADGPVKARVMAEWSAHLQRHDMTAAQAEAHFAAWADEDTYRPLATELALLAAAGFAEPECFSKHGPTTVFGAFR